MVMNNSILVSVIIILLIPGCKKDEDKPEMEQELHKSILVESVTYDTDGVVFKITNDISHGFNYNEEYEHNKRIWQDLDSVYFKRFHVLSANLEDKDSYVLIGKGDYVCWRYKYEYTGTRGIYMGFINSYAINEDYKYCIFGTDLGFSTSNYYKIKFPEPVNDTVYVKMSSFFYQLHK
jgi:hypothetical protein